MAVTWSLFAQIIERDLAQTGFTPARKAQISLLEHSRGHVLAIELASIRVPFTEVRVSQDSSASMGLTNERGFGFAWTDIECLTQVCHLASVWPQVCYSQRVRLHVTLAID